ncbi:MULTISPECIES: hypothetical protein [Rhodococcus]|uniref:hypothetical protein n=1 Tax=Rhodococcus TaxID=1827 RepID=UPI0007DA2DFE|nr:MULTISPECIES: hypothetical protein [Rhodococcus]APE12665.1 hypothetical protein BO226_25275 [Rhodococcus sp. 2G]MCF8786165.1 hypothetical protein [Rhodococcus ruber]
MTTTPAPAETSAELYPLQVELHELFKEQRQLQERIDAAAIGALKEYTARRYPTATTLMLDSNGNPNEYLPVAVHTGAGEDVVDENAVAADETLFELVRTVPMQLIRYDRTSNLWKIALR